MTCIAWDGKTLAADKRSSTSWGAHDTVRKIWRHGDVLIGQSGNAAVSARMVEWFKAGAAPADFPTDAAKDDASTLIVIVNGQPTQYTTGPYPMVIEQSACAWGSGRDFAQTALYLGKTAREAVEIACLLSSNCGNGIDILTLAPP